MNFNRKHVVFYLIAILLIACSVRVARVLIKTRMSADEIEYVYIAKDLAAGNANEISHYPPPLLPGLMALGTLFGINTFLVGIIITVLFGTLLPLAFYFAADALFERSDYAVFAALLAAVQPYFCRMGANVWRDGPYIVLLVFALNFAIRGAKYSKLRDWVVFALFVFLCSITRNEAFEIYLAFIVYLGIEAVINCRKWRNLYLKLINVFIVVTIVFFGLFGVTYYFCQEIEYKWQPFIKYQKEVLQKNERG